MRGVFVADGVVDEAAMEDGDKALGNGAYSFVVEVSGASAGIVEGSAGIVEGSASGAGLIEQ